MRAGWVSVAVVLCGCQAAEELSTDTATVDEQSEHGGLSCAIVRTAPGAGDDDVDVSRALSITWSTAVDARTLDGRVILRTAGGDEVPLALRLEARGTRATLTPEHELRNFASYTLSVADGVQSSAGRSCRGGQVSFSTRVPHVMPRPLRPAAATSLVRVGDTIITASPTYRGLQVYRAGAPDRVHLLGDVETAVEPRRLRVDGRRLYAAAGLDGFLLFDVANPVRPRQIAHVPGRGGFTHDVAPFSAGGRRYLATVESPFGVRVFDVSDARAIVDLGTTDPAPGADSDPRALAVQGSLLVVGNAPRDGYTILSLADPAHPAPLSTTAIGREVFALAPAGELLYVAIGFYGLRSFDISDPAHPLPLAEVSGPHGPCSFNCQDPLVGLALDGDRLWVAALHSGAPSYRLDGAGGMTLANVLPVAGSALALLPEDDGVFVAAEEGLVVFGRDATAGTPPLWFDPSGHGIVRGLARSAGGAFLYAAASVQGLVTYAAPFPLLPFVVDRASTPGSSGDVDQRAAMVLAEGDTLFVGDGRKGLSIFDLARAAHPALAGSTTGSDSVEAMQLDGDVLYACDDNVGLVVYDVADRRAPRAMASLRFDPPDLACLSLHLAGSRLYIGGWGALGVADVSDPAHPVMLSQTNAPDEAAYVALSRSPGGEALYAVAAVGFAAERDHVTQLRALDLADPVHPRLVSTSGNLGHAPLSQGILVIGDKAFVAAREAGLQVFDLAAPLAPVLEGRIPTPGSALGVIAGRKALYVAQGAGGVAVVSLAGHDDGD